MDDIKRHIDTWSWIVLFITSVLFIVALFLKGLTHELSLEAGVFLVSLKLIMMAYKHSVVSAELKVRLDDVQAVLTRLEGGLQSRHAREAEGGSPDTSSKPARPRSKVDR